MDFVSLMYRYINRFINGEKLYKELQNVDLSDYTLEEQEIVRKLILDVKNIIDTISNEVDEVEKNRLSQVEKLLNSIDNARKNSNNDEEVNSFLERQYQNLIKEKEITKDGGKLYQSLFQLLTENSLICSYAKGMNSSQLLDFITHYISVPNPPLLTQTDFDELVEVGIQKDKRESLWRLAFNYNGKDKDFSKIEDYFILKRDSYYLTELISAVKEDLNLKRLIQKVKDTRDKDFISKCVNECKNLGLITDEEIEKCGFLSYFNIF